MKNSSVFSCEHIHVRCASGKTDLFVAALQKYLRIMFNPPAEVGSADLELTLDSRVYSFQWLGEDRPASDEGAIDAMPSASEIDVRLSMCCDTYCMESAQTELAMLLKGGPLKDHVRYCVLLEDETTSSLLLSGMYRGSFLHGAVPFTTGNEDVLVNTTWNGYTHRAEFSFPASAEDDVRDIADLLEDRLEIELILSDDASSMKIASLQLVGQPDVEFYRDMLKKLADLSEKALITGALTPESETMFALLSFVQEGSSVAVLTAVAER